MEEITNKNIPSSSSRSYSQIVIVVVVTALLSILATYFVMSSKTSKQSMNSQEPQTTQTVKQVAKSADKDQTFSDFIKDARSYTKTGTSVKTDCYKEDIIPQDERFAIIKKTLQRDNRIIYKACVSSQSNNYLIVSAIKKSEQYNEPYEVSVDMYNFYDKENNYTSDILFHEENKDARREFTLIDWLSNGDVVYSLINQYPYYSNTYLYNSAQGTSAPQLIEYCDLGIAKGTSERGFVKCTRFAESKNSLYLKQTDLP